MGALDELVEISRMRRRLPEPAMRQHLRRRARLTQEDVAEAVGVDRATLSRWESGARTPRGDRLARYVAVLDRLAAS